MLGKRGRSFRVTKSSLKALLKRTDSRLDSLAKTTKQLVKSKAPATDKEIRILFAEVCCAYADLCEILTYLTQDESHASSRTKP